MVVKDDQEVVVTMDSKSERESIIQDKNGRTRRGIVITSYYYRRRSKVKNLASGPTDKRTVVNKFRFLARIFACGWRDVK